MQGVDLFPFRDFVTHQTRQIDNTSKDYSFHFSVAPPDGYCYDVVIVTAVLEYPILLDQKLLHK
jgi:hypothetical protein